MKEKDREALLKFVCALEESLYLMAGQTLWGERNHEYPNGVMEPFCNGISKARKALAKDLREEKQNSQKETE